MSAPFPLPTQMEANQLLLEDQERRARGRIWSLWHTSPEAMALLASCAANPPRRVRKLASLASWMKGSPEYVEGFDENDERWDELKMLASAAFLAAEAADADLRNWPRIDDLIELAISRGRITPVEQRA